MRLEIGIPVSGANLAEILRDNDGTFLCQHGGQSYLTVSAAGHSIKFGPKPVGRRNMVLGSEIESWSVTKISEQDLSSELGQSRSGRTQREDRP